ncbi:carbon-nitrogen hydrolase family protein [Sporanaerobacter sp. PP17-6a]|jgi:predicted amidohydrolase|uniref:carbon-nitrogen hydrolase family protein n=1 Tax=Sporanaerobacter sp. PP17-6a TaxID=1891289 RepID=UPI00089F91DA|nr:carbon-nitrogen hydrolase family protein [Sporanaerobacter sp. PP17-6a]SCL88349.1 (R)-stereoselective amidase [Sporanaerobacter sp. PP17-6a]
MRKFIIAALQLNSNDNKKQNLRNVITLIEEAAERKAKIVAMPENMNYVGVEKESETIPGYTTNLLAEQAVKYNIYIHCGSISEDSKTGRPYNTTVFINPKGEIICKYRKLHMFDVDIKEGPSFRESDNKTPGSEIVTIETEYGNLGFSICYDIRFPEMYRIMALNGAQIIFAPACFVMNTGKDHWEPLLRARAIENTCYIVAPAQIGIKPSYQAYGKTLIVDPWGNVIAKAMDKPCVVTSEIDLDYLENIRKQVPSLKNRRSDIYDLKKVIKNN